MSAKLSYCFLVALVYPFASPAREWVSCVEGWGIWAGVPLCTHRHSGLEAIAVSAV